jgi:hypothetical protein
VGENAREKGRERNWKKGGKKKMVIKRVNKRKIGRNKTKRAYDIKKNVSWQGKYISWKGRGNIVCRIKI